MKIKFAFFTILVLILATGAGLRAVDTSQIDKVRNKGVLDNEDFQVIDKFIFDAVDELVKTRDFTATSKMRGVISSRASSQAESSAAQYAQQFSESLHKHLAAGFAQADELKPESARFKVVVNLLILLDEMADLRLTDLAIKRLKDSNKSIQYWAVRSLTNPAIVKQLRGANPASNSKLTRSVIEQLHEIVDGSSPDVSVLIAEFAAKVGTPQGEELLLQIADARIGKYADWTVDNEPSDIAILGLLADRMSAGDTGSAAAGQRFGQLYSYAIQRYVKGVKDGNFLNSEQKQRLASVLVETEKACIDKLLEISQSVIQKAVESDDCVNLMGEHNRLLGDEAKAGQLAEKFRFDYGKSLNGSKRTAPLVLPEPPAGKKND